MKKTELEPNWSVVVCDKGEPFKISKFEFQIMPIELHVKPDGDMDDNPSYALVLIDAKKKKYVAQISHRMLNSGLEKAKEMLEE